MRDVFADIKPVKIDKEMLSLAKDLIESKAGDSQSCSIDIFICAGMLFSCSEAMPRIEKGTLSTWGTSRSRNGQRPEHVLTAGGGSNG